MTSRLALVLILTSQVFSETLYVDVDARGRADGSSWLNAYNHLQDALTAAASSSAVLEIRVAKGRYTPDTGHGVTRGDRQATFALINNVVIKGGYAGFGAPDPNERNLQTYETILSGDLNDNDQYGFMGNDENSYRVVTVKGEDANAVLDGFTVTAGNANVITNSYPFYNCGGGVTVEQGSLTITDCMFVGNHAFAGGGVYNVGAVMLVRCSFSGNLVDRGNNRGKGGGMFNHGTAILEGCVFTDNQAAARGGGMFNEAYSHAQLTDCIFAGNRADYGGGMFNFTFSDVEITGGRFTRNLSLWRGGGMYNSLNSLAIHQSLFLVNSTGESGGGIYNNRTDMTLTHSLFVSNMATEQYGNGGGILSHHGDLKISNCVFYSNMAYAYGGGICNEDMEHASITQCILWKNVAEEGPQVALIKNTMENTSIQYCNVHGGKFIVYQKDSTVLWAHNIDVNPEFAQPGYWDRGVWIEGDYHLKSQAGRWDPNSASWVRDDVTSPCIDAGDPALDWGGELWPHGERINMGAYGGMSQASMSLLQSGYAADLDNSGTIGMFDIALLSETWLAKQSLLYEDLNRDGHVNFMDFAMCAAHWLWE